MGSTGTRKLIAVGISGVLAACLVSFAAWMVVAGDASEQQPDGVQIIAPAEDSDPSVAAAPSTTISAPAPLVNASHKEIAVYITGEVVNPGVYRVADGGRLDAVLRLAGGPTESADLSRINLAAYATDAAHYAVPRAGEPVGRGPAPDDGATSNAADAGAPDACETPVNINTASAQCLETLPGIGAVRADSIVAHREQEGSFAGPEAITDVPGIGDGIYRRIADMITVAAR